MAGLPIPMTLVDLLRTGPDERPALLEVSGRGLTWGELRGHLGGVAAALAARGVRPGDPVAVIMPNGPDLAAAFLACALGGAAAPLNPAYREDELDFYLGDLEPKALLVATGLETPVRRVAQARGVAVIEVAPGSEPGGFTLDGAPVPPAALPEVSPDAVALFLHTSGTTARPKGVPLTQRNLATSATAIARTLGLGPDDRALAVMPLFHIHGLVATVLAPLAAGGALVATPGFEATRALGWLASTGATWTSAVPTMLQALAARAEGPDLAAVRAAGRLRLVRSSSSSLAPATFAALEAALGVPVVESYGMTEAAHQMASNALPPGERRPGAVGRALPEHGGPEVAVRDEDGQLHVRAGRGEVVVRGASIFAGYHRNPEATRAAFVEGGWFRTGDEGVLDEHGVLTLTGRLKELINRGGEKIAPREVDEALLAHPAVQQAVAFAVPEPELGEEVHAAVVLRAGHAATEDALRQHVADRLAYFKVPRRVHLVAAIPLGPTGKLQRIGLAARLGVAARPAPQDDLGPPPATPVEEVVALAWREVLGEDAQGTAVRFTRAGGDSFGVLRWVARVRELLAVELPLLPVLDEPTIARVAALAERALTDAG